MSDTRSYEPDLSRAGPLWWLLGLTLGGVLLLSGLIWGLFGEARTPATVPDTDVSESRVPALQRAPVEDYQAFRRQARQQLDRLGWVDREAGVVHIPISQAMDLLVERGLPGEERQ